MDMLSEKENIRSHMKELREQLDFCLYRKWSSTIMETCMDLAEWKKAGTVHIYVSSINNEVDTLGMIFKLLDEGRRVIVPRSSPGNTRTLTNIQIFSLNDLMPGKFGIMEPQFIPDRVVKTEVIDLVISPLLAFDRQGGRLGFGKGYYDSFLQSCVCPKIGLGYAFQEIDKVPMEPHDQKLDIIVTEKDVIRISHERT
jgi:5-formyltetrahydrofolate cyclo-ligase